jgi:hypothetical protein
MTYHTQLTRTFFAVRHLCLHPQQRVANEAESHDALRLQHRLGWG